MTQEVTEAALADIMSVPKAIAARWRETGKITPQANGLYDLAAHAHLAQVKDMLTSTWKDDIQKPARDYKCIELFAGAGGMALGLEAAGFETECLYELDKDACNTLRRNRPHWNVYEGDVSDVDFTQYKGIDLIAGGFPCQAFSVIGKKLGFEDTRGTLFYEFARAIKETQPKVFVGENVRGLLTHDKGRTLGTIKQVLKDLGYTLIDPQVLKAIFHRVPQKRERLFLVGIRNDLTGTFKWPAPCHRIFTLRDALHAGELYPSNCPVSKGVPYAAKKHAVLSLIPPGGCWVDLPEDMQKSYLGSSYEKGGGKTGMARRLSWDEPSLTLVCSPDQKQTERCHPAETRPLTVREYARIQTFPDNWGFSGSVRSRYKQIGNAVPCNLAEAVGHSLIALLNSIESDTTPKGDIRRVEMTHMVKVSSNLKNGVSTHLSPKTIIVGANRSGKTSILQAIELALSNTVSDLEGRDTVKAVPSIHRVFPHGETRFFSAVEMSDGTVFEWAHNLTSTKSKKPQITTAPYEVSFLTRELSAALLGNGATIRKFLFKHVCSTSVWEKVYNALGEDEKVRLKTVFAGMSMDNDPELVASACSSHALKLKKQADVLLKQIEAVTAGHSTYGVEVLGSLTTRQSELCVALRAKKDGITAEDHAALMQEIDERANVLAVQYGDFESIHEEGTRILTELIHTVKNSHICPSGDLIRDLIDTTKELVVAELSAKAFSRAAAWRSEHDFLMSEAAAFKDLAAFISKAGERHFNNAMLTFQDEVNNYVPQSLGRFFVDLSIMRVGLMSDDGTFRSALSGAEQVAVHMAVSCAFPKNDSTITVVTAPDVAWDAATLTDTMRALTQCEHQVVLTSTVAPEPVDGWDIIHI